MYPSQPIFVVGAWGWPQADGAVSPYYSGVFEKVVENRYDSKFISKRYPSNATVRNAKGDNHVYFIDTTGWVQWADVYSDNLHPNPSGHVKIAAEFKAWLINWGLNPETSWRTQPS